ncbi:hypothetical protein MRX96_017131 [Rhipicephalus microplus]
MGPRRQTIPSVLSFPKIHLDPPYDLPAPGVRQVPVPEGGQPFPSEPEEQWVVEPGHLRNPYKPAEPLIFRMVTGLKPAERRFYYKSLSANGPPGGVRAWQVPAAVNHACRLLWSILTANKPIKPRVIPTLFRRHCLARACWLPHRLPKPATSYHGARAPSTHEQSNWASQSCAGQVPRVHSDRPGSSKAEAGEPSASQATQLLIDHPKKPVLVMEAKAVTGEHHGAWDEARVGQPCGAEVTHSTGNLGAAQALANQPWALRASTIQDKSAPLAPGPAYAKAIARRFMALGHAYRQ